MEKHKEFLNKVKTDKALMEKVKAVKKSAKEEMVAGVLKVAKEAGYDLNADELTRAFTEVKGELSDKDLETVAAGGGARGDCGSGSVPLY